MASSTPHLGAYRNLTDKFMKYRERYRNGGGLGARPSRDRDPRGRPASSVRASSRPASSRRAPLPTEPRSPSLTSLAPSTLRLRRRLRALPRGCIHASARGGHRQQQQHGRRQRGRRPRGPLRHPSPRVGRFQRGGDERHSAHPRETQGAQRRARQGAPPQFRRHGHGRSRRRGGDPGDHASVQAVRGATATPGRGHRASHP